MSELCGDVLWELSRKKRGGIWAKRVREIFFHFVCVLSVGGKRKKELRVSSGVGSCLPCCV